jgi:dienelactone hydrolase
LGLSPSVAFSAELYAEDPGRYTVEAVDTFTIFDADRNKELLLRVTFPAESEEYPLIVWSHGANGSKDIYQKLITHWVSHGYVVIQPNHSDAQKAGDKGEKRETFGDWESRPADISFVLDSVAEIEAKITDLTGKIDKSAMGMGGHSFGAQTTQLIAGAEAKIPADDSYRSYADERPRAFVLLSPQGSGQRDSQLDKGSWTKMIRPMLMATGSKDPGRTGKPWQWRLEPFLNSPPEDKYALYIEGLYHGFGGLVESGLPTEGPANIEIATYAKAVTTAFWDAYLKNNDAAMELLSYGNVSRPGRRPQQAGPLPPNEIIQRFDTDGNGTLSEAEMPPRLAPAFNNLDEDGDNEVSVEELKKIQQRRR